MNRRTFLKRTGIVAGISGANRLRAAAPGISLVVDPRDPIAGGKASVWAAGELQKRLRERNVQARVYSQVSETPTGDRLIILAGGNAAVAQQIAGAAKVTLPSTPEALCLVPGHLGGRTVLLAGGSDARGLVFAVLELADRVRYKAGSPLEALEIRTPVVEKPANAIRSCARLFVSDVEDKPWFYDRAMWVDYLSELATNRFSRFNMTLGMGYNAGSGIPFIPDAYFYLAYPFLLDVPGYRVRANPLPDSERDRNLETLRFIGEETVARGLQFNLGLWSHAYEWRGPTNYTITGLTPDTHARYCRDGLAALLKACPSITGLSFRVHGESGIPDGRYDFWETLFQAIPQCGRRIDIDVHAKGTNPRHIDIALGTGMPVSMAPKFWAEHLGMPYHQAAIRELEWSDHPETDRRFLRYGYGDYLRDDRKYGIVHRIWPGTQRHLLWGDPAMAAGYGRAFNFCGSLGVELCEPLSFKGRMGSGKPGGRNAYADKSLDPPHDWEKFRYQYRVWGRSIYNPDTDPDGWKRYLRQEFHAAAEPLETALAQASRIMPVITTAHDPSASNNSYWPEMYTNMPIVDPKSSEPYRDTPAPRKFGTVSPLDPQLFTTIEECAEALLSGQTGAKYASNEVAQWLSDCAAAASQGQVRMNSATTNAKTPEFRRVAADIAIQGGIGQFFAWKIRSAVLWAIYERTSDRTALTEAVGAYRQARQTWANMAELAKKIYTSDITYGPNPAMLGHWIDRLPAIDADLADMEKHLGQMNPATAGATDAARIRRAIEAVQRPAKRPVLACKHTQASHFVPGEPLEVALLFPKPAARKVNLLYRHVDQGERWRTIEMQSRDLEYRGTIAAEYTQSPYPLQYYFEVHEAGGATLDPGFGPELSNQPYYVVRRRA